MSDSNQEWGILDTLLLVGLLVFIVAVSVGIVLCIPVTVRGTPLCF